jgi:uncharacterized membrane protein YccC
MQMNIGLGVAIGIAIGAVIGAESGTYPLWLAVGAGVGGVLAFALSRGKK